MFQNGEVQMLNYLRQNDSILFQGDSITDTGRREDPAGMGSGYAGIAAGWIQASLPEMGFRFVNRGVGGDRTTELLERWKEDCEDLRPQVLSVKIGVNDVWRILGSWNGQHYVPVEEYADNYRRLLDRALKAGTRQLILCSPTTIDNGTNREVSELLAERRDIVKALAAEYRALYVPLQETQASLMEKRPDIAWTVDGCHPSAAGHAALAKCWIETVVGTL